MVKFQVLLARGQVLQAEGSIGVLGGRAESLGKANQNRRGGQELCVGMSLPGGQQVSAAAWPVISRPAQRPRNCPLMPQLGPWPMQLQQRWSCVPLGMALVQFLPS